jgi:hypothetical protein
LDSSIKVYWLEFLFLTTGFYDGCTVLNLLKAFIL